MPTRKATKDTSRSEYHPRLADIAKEFALGGKTSREIADSLHIHLNTFYNWMHEHEDFKKAVQEGKDLYDSENVEKALLEDALGHEKDEVVLERNKQGKLVEVKRTKKWQRNYQAQALWLRNRNPERWRDVHELVVSSKDLEAKLAAAEKRLAAMRNGNGETSTTGDQ